MSLLKFLFKDKQAKREEPAGEVAVAEPVAETEVAPSELETRVLPPDDVVEDHAPEPQPVAAAPADDTRKLDLDEIREALRKIAEIISDDDKQERDREVASGNYSTLNLTVGQVAGLVPEIFRDPATATENGQYCKASVKDLYEQLAAGKVQTTLNHLAGEIDEDLLVPTFENRREDVVNIPLNLAVTAVQPDELKKRTTVDERDDGLDEMPNLFNAPSVAGTDEHAPEPAIEFQDDDEETEAATRMLDPAMLEQGGISAAVPDASVDPSEVDEEEDDETEAQTRMLDPSMVQAAADALLGCETDEPPVEAEPEIPEAAAGLPADIPLVDDPIFGRSRTDGPLVSETLPGMRLPFAEEPSDDEPPAEAAASADAIPGFEIDDSVSVFRMASDDTDEADDAGAAAMFELPPMDEPAVAAFEPAASIAVPQDDEDRVSSEAVAPAGHGEVVLNGVNLNTASDVELSEGLDGVGAKLAARIRRYRERTGRFTCIEDLTKVPGVGPSTFEKITGTSWSEARDSVRRTLNYLFGSDQNEMPDFKQVAKRFVELPGFKGCILTHEEGHVLAANWDHEGQEMLGAIAPQLYKKVTPYVEDLDMGEVNPLTLFIADEAVTIVYSGDMFIALVHSTTRLNKRQVNLIQLAGAELEHRLDRMKAAIG